MTETLEARFQTQTVARTQEFSRIKEVVSGWSGVRQYLRGGDEGQIVPVVILKDRRRYGWLFLVGVGVYLLGFALSTALLHTAGIGLGLGLGRAFGGSAGRLVTQLAGGATALGGLWLALGA